VKLSTLLDDVRVDAALAPDEIALERPMRPDLRSVSLAGELALAMFQRMVRAREVVVCPSCGEIEIFPDMRHREICSKPECRAWLRSRLCAPRSGRFAGTGSPKPRSARQNCCQCSIRGTDGISTRFTRRVLPGTVLDRRRFPPVVAQCDGAVAVIANLVAGLPRAAGRLSRE